MTYEPESALSNQGDLSHTRAVLQVGLGHGERRAARAICKRSDLELGGVGDGNMHGNI